MESPASPLFTWANPGMPESTTAIVLAKTVGAVHHPETTQSGPVSHI